MARLGFGLALITGLALYTRFRNSEFRLAALEREWSAARLAALRMQLSPHTIRGYIECDPKGAQAMVVPMLRISRSCLVNMNYVRQVNRTLRGDFILSLAGGATVTSSEGFRAKVKDYLGTLKLAP